MKKPKKPTKPSVAKLDRLWTELIHTQRKGACEYCGKREGLNAHHIFSRSNRSTRWDDQNAVLLCTLHHVFGNFSAHKSPVEFVEWLKERRSDAWYKELRRRAVAPAKMDHFAVLQDLEAKLAKAKLES